MLHCNNTALLQQLYVWYNPTAPLQECSSTVTPMFRWLHTALLQHHCPTATLLLCCKNTLLCNTAALLQHVCSTHHPTLLCTTPLLRCNITFEPKHRCSVATPLLYCKTTASLQHRCFIATPLLYFNDLLVPYRGGQDKKKKTENLYGVIPASAQKHVLIFSTKFQRKNAVWMSYSLIPKAPWQRWLQRLRCLVVHPHLHCVCVWGCVSMCTYTYMCICICIYIRPLYEAP